MTTPLTVPEIAAALEELPGWRLDNRNLVAAFHGPRGRLADFYSAVTTIEDRLDHHARITVLYDTIEFQFATHFVGNKVTERDVTAARELNVIAVEFEFTTK